MKLEAIKYKRGELQILNQLLLPYKTEYEIVKDSNDGYKVIKSMKVRGAPAIAIVAALSLAVELYFQKFENNHEVLALIKSRLEFLKTSRPTAVNLFEACDRLMALVGKHSSSSAEEIALVFIVAAEEILLQDYSTNKAIGLNGANYILENAGGNVPLNVLTHCNTGSLATSGHGTALGIIRDLHALGKLNHTYCTETRPYNQGSRLTAFELVFEKIPSTLICDSMVSALLRTKNISAIIVGADRVASNGDTANKIGTYQLAISAAYHNVMFIVAAPLTSIDLNTPDGDSIEIEERAGVEVTSIKGKTDAGVMETVHIAAPGINVWNPAFDVVPASLITAIATERGMVLKRGKSFDMKSVFPENI